MGESKEVFDDRVKEPHIQLKQVREFHQLCQEGKAISGMSMEEQEALLMEFEGDVLEYSNDTLFDIIIAAVRNGTEDSKLLEIIENMKVANIPDDDSIIGRAYPKYYDGSYYIEVARCIERRICLLSDLFAAFFMDTEKLGDIEKLMLQELLDVSVQSYLNDEENKERFNEVQLHIMACDGMIRNDFTDSYLIYASEIHEMAMAFFVGHEIGHHYYGHTDQENKSSMSNITKELMADSYGIDFACDYLTSKYTNTTNNDCYGIHQFAGIYIPIIASAYLCDDIYKGGKTHPSIAKRLLEVNGKVNALLDRNAFQDVQDYIRKLCETVHFFG